MFRKIYSNIGGSLLFRSFGVVFTLLLNFVIAKLCGSEGYGLFYQGLAIFTIITVLSRFGLDNFSLIKVSEHFSKANYTEINLLLKKIYTFLLPVIALIVLIFLLSADFIANNYYKDPKLATPIRLFSLAFIPFVLLQINSESLKGITKIKLSSFLQGFLPNALTLILGILFYYLFFDTVIGFISAYVLSFWVVFALSLFNIKQNLSRYKLGFVKFSVKLKELLRSTKTFWLIASLSVISTNLDAIVLGYFLESNIVGIYGAAAKVSLIISFILPSINSAMAPEFVKNFVKKDYITLGKLANKSSMLMSIFSLPLALILTIFSSEIMGLFGKEFSNGGIILAILSWGQFFNAVTGSVGYLLMSAHLEKFLLLSLIYSLFISLVLSIILIPIYGIIGAAISVAFSIAFQNLYSSYICYKKLSIVPLFFIKNHKNEYKK